jgi:hypothetical protein
MFQFNDTSSPDIVDEGFDNEPQSLSLMGGIAGGSDAGEGFGVPAENEQKKMTAQTSLIVAIICVVAFGALLTMRATLTNPTAAAASADTDAFMETLDVRLANLDNMDKADPLHPDNMNKLFTDSQKLIEVIKADRTLKQVPIDQVAKNPFALPSVEEVLPEVDQAALAEAKRQARLNELRAEVAAIQITSIVGGPRPVAIIGGELYRVGDKLGNFTVLQIDPRGVAFTADGIELREGEKPFISFLTRG